MLHSHGFLRWLAMHLTLLGQCGTPPIQPIMPTAGLFCSETNAQRFSEHLSYQVDHSEAWPLGPLTQAKASAVRRGLRRNITGLKNPWAWYEIDQGSSPAAGESLGSAKLQQGPAGQLCTLLRIWGPAQRAIGQTALPLHSLR